MSKKEKRPWSADAPAGDSFYGDIAHNSWPGGSASLHGVRDIWLLHIKV